MCEVHNTETNFAGSLLGRSHFCNKNRITYMTFLQNILSQEKRNV